MLIEEFDDDLTPFISSPREQFPINNPYKAWSWTAQQIVEFFSMIPTTKHIFENQKVINEFLTRNIDGSVIFGNVLQNDIRFLENLGLNYHDQVAVLSTMTFLQNKCEGYQSWINEQNDKVLQDIISANVVERDENANTDEEDVSASNRMNKHLFFKSCKPVQFTKSSEMEYNSNFNLAVQVLCPQSNPQHAIKNRQHSCSIYGCQDKSRRYYNEPFDDIDQETPRTGKYFWNSSSIINSFVNYTLPSTLNVIFEFINFSLKWIALLSLIGAALYPKETIDIMMRVQGQIRMFVDQRIESLVNTGVLARFR